MRNAPQNAAIQICDDGDDIFLFFYFFFCCELQQISPESNEKHGQPVFNYRIASLPIFSVFSAGQTEM